ncbi:MAG: putative lipid II flippase FtsW [Planctomycetes bacterium]|nr:putative lipid II flippase FtsW [Planctomycetota bacterium]
MAATGLELSQNRAAGAPGAGALPQSLRDATGSILAIVAVLLAIGLVMVASTAPANNPPLARYLVLKHTVWLAAAFLALFVAYSIDYHRLRPFTVPILFLSLASLAGVLFFGATVNGARRWFRFGELSVQPSEFCKLALCLYMADFLARAQERIRTFLKGFVQPMLIMGVAFVLILKEPDFGTALLIAVVTFGMLFVAGIRMIHVVPALVASLPLLVYLAMRMPHVWQRIVTFVDPWADPQGSGYQIVQSLIALGSGGLTGVGLGNSRQKLLYLPEANSDFVLSIVGEELGFVGVAFVVALFALLFWCGVRVARRAPDLYGSLLAFGITFTVGLQAAVNVAVVTCSAPTKGIALPFVSAGGSALVATMAGVGLLMNVASHIEAEAPPTELGAVKLGRRMRDA